MELLELIFSIIPWIIGIAIALVVGFVSLLFTLLWIGFNQFDGVDVEDIEETILNNQLKRLQKATGMTFPPYTARFKEPVTDLNGSFYGVIFIEFKELLKEDYWVELEKRIKDADPYSLWVDHKLKTSIILNLDKDKHYIYLKYSRIYTEGSKHGAFRICDNRDVQPLDIKDIKEMFGGLGSFGVFGSKQPLQESEETTPEKPTEISKEDS